MTPSCDAHIVPVAPRWGRTHTTRWQCEQVGSCMKLHDACLHYQLQAAPHVCLKLSVWGCVCVSVCMFVCVRTTILCAASTCMALAA